MTEKTLDAPKSAAVLTIGCKLPNGLICELGKYGEDNYQRVELKGANDANIIGGYGLTHGVPTAFWNAWIKVHERFPFVLKGLVFAERDVASARDQAADFAEKRTGMERLNPADVAKVAPGAEMDADHFKQAMRDAGNRARSMA